MIIVVMVTIVIMMVMIMMMGNVHRIDIQRMNTESNRPSVVLMGMVDVGDSIELPEAQRKQRHGRYENT